MQRLNKFIASSGLCSRRKADEMIEAGKVLVNGKVVKELGFQVGPKDKVVIDKQLIKPQRHEYYKFYKPAGYITTASDEKNRKTIYDIIPQELRHLKPVGRLDKESTGLIILTNDGELANKLMHPSSNIEKTYVVKVDGLVTGKDIKTLRNGVIINGNKTYPAKVKLKSYNKKTDKSIVVLTIHEGKNHQVKNMFKVLGYDVLKLKREKYADLGLVGLRVGEYRKLTNKEVSVLYSKIKTTK